MDRYNIEGHRPVVLVNGRINGQVLPFLENYCDIRKWTMSDIMPVHELEKAIPEADALIVAYRSHVPESAIRRGCRLQIIAQAFVGYENVDVAACTACGIPFCNAVSSSVNSVAELAMGLIFAAARNLTLCDRYSRGGEWMQHEKYPYLFGFELQGSTMGIIGLGHIGLAIARKAQGCGMNIVYHNRKQRTDDTVRHLRFVSQEELYHISDVIVNVLPATPETYQSIGTPDFAAMKKSALFINVGRGNTVRTADLVKALQQGDIAQAALDVVDLEPLPPTHPLLLLPNVIITPHIGGNTRCSWTEKARQTAQNVLHRFAGRSLRDCLNPEVLHP